MEQKDKQTTSIWEMATVQTNPVLKHQTLFFLAVSLLYGVCFAFSFYKNFVGAAYLLVVAATLLVCVLFLQKSGLLQRSGEGQGQENLKGGRINGNSVILYDTVPILLLGISTVLTTNYFMVFFNTVGILLLFAVFMLRRVYPGAQWSPGRFLCNIVYLALNMIPQVAAPFLNLADHVRGRKKKEESHPYRNHIIAGILIGIPLLLFVVVLLNSADVIFAKYVGGGVRYLWEHLFVSEDLVLVIVLLLLGFFGIYTFLSALTLNNMPRWEQKRQKKNPVTAITFLVMITAVYLVFCIIQLAFLFTGGLVLPDGYTYAEYAHQGFFQLLFLCMFNLALVLLCMELFERNRLLKILLVLFSACTYVMIASSAMRMILYISSYRLTFLRVLVLWFLALLAVLMAGVITQILKKDFPLFRYGMAVVTAFYLLLSLAHPDYWIAKYNVAENGEELDYGDVSYLCSLSMDAAPVLSELRLEHGNHPGIVRYENGGENAWCSACELEGYFVRIQQETSELNIRTFNLSKYRAKEAADAYLKECK